jgi:hypothetical protein
MVYVGDYANVANLLFFAHQFEDFSDLPKPWQG